MKTIDDGEGSRIISQTDISPEAIDSAKRLLVIGRMMQKEEETLKWLIPDGHSFQFFGKWDCLLIKKSERSEDSD
jgi:hypothetical protein